MVNWRIFWTCSLVELSDGYYHMFVNWWTNKSHHVFAGYNVRAINKESTSWKTVKERLK